MGVRHHFRRVLSIDKNYFLGIDAPWTPHSCADIGLVIVFGMDSTLASKSPCPRGRPKLLPDQRDGPVAVRMQNGGGREEWDEA